jgi:nucleotide-binding universal stress UspA family protein
MNAAMKTMLMLAHQDNGFEARLQVSLDLARALGCHLSCIDGVVAPKAMDYVGCSDVAHAEPVLERNRQGTVHEARLKARLARENVAWNWINATGFLGDSLAIASDMVDLVVVSIGFGDNERPALRKLASYLATSSSRPIFAVPRDNIGLDVTGTVLVVWDGSRPADEALGDAMPLLKLARDVVLLDITDNASKLLNLPASLAARYLSHHGIHSIVEPTQHTTGEATCTAILEKAHEIDAACIVMSAFGHSSVSGAVARSLLAQSDLPLFLPHC